MDWTLGYPLLSYIFEVTRRETFPILSCGASIGINVVSGVWFVPTLVVSAAEIQEDGNPVWDMNTLVFGSPEPRPKPWTHLAVSVTTLNGRVLGFSLALLKKKSAQ